MAYTSSRYFKCPPIECLISWQKNPKKYYSDSVSGDANLISSRPLGEHVHNVRVLFPILYIVS